MTRYLTPFTYYGHRVGPLLYADPVKRKQQLEELREMVIVNEHEIKHADYPIDPGLILYIRILRALVEHHGVTI